MLSSNKIQIPKIGSNRYFKDLEFSIDDMRVVVSICVLFVHYLHNNQYF